MIVRNKKNGTNVLVFQNSRVIIRGGETVDIPELKDLNEVVNKADFGNRGWFEIIEIEEKIVTEKETNLEKAKKEVREYTSKTKQE